MDTIRVCVVELDGKRLTVGMYSQLEHKACRNDEGVVQGDVLGWVNRKVGGCASTEPHYLWVRRGDVFDEVFVDCIHFELEMSDAIRQAAHRASSRTCTLSPEYAEYCQYADGYGDQDLWRMEAAKRKVQSLIRQTASTYMDAYRNSNPDLDPDVRLSISAEVSQLEQQHQMLKALPQLFVGR